MSGHRALATSVEPSLEFYLHLKLHHIRPCIHTNVQLYFKQLCSIQFNPSAIPPSAAPACPECTSPAAPYPASTSQQQASRSASPSQQALGSGLTFPKSHLVQPHEWACSSSSPDAILVGKGIEEEDYCRNVDSHIVGSPRMLAWFLIYLPSSAVISAGMRTWRKLI